MLCRNLIRGNDFRQAFKRIGGLRAMTKVPFMTLTASASPSVQEDIIQSLSLTNVVYVRHSLDRPNIHLSVAKKSSLAVSKFITIISQFNVSSLNREIYLVL